MAKALLDLKAGVDPGVAYGKTVRELTANALFDWLSEWGDDYGCRAAAAEPGGSEEQAILL